MIDSIKRLFARLFQSRGLLSHSELLELIEQGVIDAHPSQVKGSTIDLTLHHIVRKEVIGSAMRIVRLHKGESIETEEVDMFKNGGEHVMMPDAVMLGATREFFNMPLNLSAEFSLKSTLGRNFLGHELAGWIDPGFSGTITLELKNNNQFHKLALAPGMPIGQVKFFRHKSVPYGKSYAVHGQYNGQDKVQASKVIR